MVREGNITANPGWPAKANWESVQTNPNHGRMISPTKEEANMVKQGTNIKFICTYLFNNPGAKPAQIRRALCEDRGIDATKRPGYYAAYVYTNRFNHHFTFRDGGFYLTSRGLAQVQA